MAGSLRSPSGIGTRMMQIWAERADFSLDRKKAQTWKTNYFKTSLPKNPHLLAIEHTLNNPQQPSTPSTTLSTHFKVDGQTKSEVGIFDAAISSNFPCTLIKFSKPLAFSIDAATVER